MKTLYVPKGETFEYERLYVPNVIVDGVLIVHHYMYISKIMGKGFIKAEKMVCDELLADSVEAKEIVAGSVTVRKLFADKCTVNGKIVVTDYAAYENMKALEFVGTFEDIDRLEAGSVIHVRRRQNRGILSVLFFAWCRKCFLDLFQNSSRQKRRIEKNVES